MDSGKKKKRKLVLSEHKKQIWLIISWIFLLMVLILGVLASGNNAIMIGSLAWLTLALIVILTLLDIIHKNRRKIKARLILPENGEGEREPEKLKSFAVEVIPGDRHG